MRTGRRAQHCVCVCVCVTSTFGSRIPREGMWCYTLNPKALNPENLLSKIPRAPEISSFVLVGQCIRT